MPAYNILVLGESGTGKSVSMRNLDPKSTAIINVAAKPLPFRGWRKKYTVLTKDNPQGNMVHVNTPQGVKDAIKYFNSKRPEIKVIIVDDFQYVSVFEYFDRAFEKGFDKFTEIGAKTADIARINLQCRDDLYIVYMMHTSTEIDRETGEQKVTAKTIGKMISNTLTLEGLFNIALYTKVMMKDGADTPSYFFDTQNDGNNTCKTSMDMFSTRYIDNDMKMVIDTIHEYENDETI